MLLIRTIYQCFWSVTFSIHRNFLKFEYCRYARHVRQCTPRSDGISSFENLLKNVILRVFVWTIGLLTTVGNVWVLISRAFMKAENKVHTAVVISLCSKSISLSKKEWICSLFKEWILEKSEIRVNLEWTFVLFTHFGVTSGITRNPWVIPVVTQKWVNKCSLQIHSNFTLSKIHSLKSEHIHSFLFIRY